MGGEDDDAGTVEAELNLVLVGLELEDVVDRPEDGGDLLVVGLNRPPKPNVINFLVHALQMFPIS